MDFFSDFSFATATNRSSRRSEMYTGFEMEDISPSSSRSASPVCSSYPSPTSAYRSHPVSMAELSANFDRHNLDAEGNPSSPLFGRLQNPSGRRSHSHAITSSPADCYDSIRRRRQSGARGLCSGARLASIETLVDRMLRDGTSCFASLHPSSGGSCGSSRHTSRKNSVTSAPTSLPTPRASSLGSEDLTEDEDESDFDGTDAVLPAHVLLSRARFGGGVAAATQKRRGGVEKSSRQRRLTLGRARP